MKGRLGRIVMVLIAMAMALAFFAPPVLKLKEPAMIVVILIGVVAMCVSFVEFVREPDDE
jgi:hypothetical protein